MQRKKITINLNLPVSIFREGKFYVAFTPALDLSTSASSYEEVKERFKEVVNIFLEETSKKGNLEENLKTLGWRKVKKEWVSPVIISQTLEDFKVPVYA